MAKQTMSEIIEAYNTLAETLGKDPVDSFKNLKAAQQAFAELQEEAAPTEDVELDPNREIIPADSGNSGPKYNTAGKRGPTQGIGAFCKGLIAEGKTNDEILELIPVAFPTAKTTRNCVAYYRAKMKTAATTVEATEEVVEEEAVA